MSFIIQGLESIGQRIENFFGGFSNDISQGITDFMKGIGDIVNAIVGGIKTFIGDVENFFNRIVSLFEGIGRAIELSLSEFWNITRMAVGEISGYIKNIANMMTNTLNELIKYLYEIYDDIKKFVTTSIQEFINILASTFGFIANIMSYPFAYIRYMFNYAIYYLITHAINLVGGFFFGMAINELRKMQFTTLDEVMHRLLFFGIKYFIMDVNVQGMFRLYAQKNKIKKPTPPPIPIFGGVKL